VRAVLQRWSLGEVTRVLRELLDGGLSIRDTGTVLERLLGFDTIRADADTYTVFDERLPVDGPLPSTPLARARMLARFVREGMSAFIGSRFSFGTETMVAYLLDQEFEELALEAAPDDREGEVERADAEAALDLLRDAVWHELSFLPPAATTPVLLTSRRARTAVRRVMAPELPDLRVVRYSEIPADLNVMPVARIAPTRAGVPTG
jgi:flagellar biosynthesis component FlhA